MHKSMPETLVWRSPDLEAAQELPPPVICKTQNKAQPVRSERFVEVNSIRVSVPIEGSKLPRNILPPEGSPGSAKATVSFKLKAGTIEFTATLKAKSYRDTLNKIDAAPYGAFAVLQGKLGPTSGVMTEAGFTVQEVKEAPKSEITS